MVQLGVRRGLVQRDTRLRCKHSRAADLDDVGVTPGEVDVTWLQPLRKGPVEGWQARHLVRVPVPLSTPQRGGAVQVLPGDAAKKGL